MKKLLLVFAVFLFLAAIPGFAQDCGQGKKLAEKTWEKWGPWQAKNELSLFKRDVQKLKTEWNWIASNSGEIVGPRFLDVDGGIENGTIIGQASSTFVTPPSFNNRLEVTINQYNGIAQTGVVICAMDRDGSLTQLETFTFPVNSKGQTKKFILNNVSGKIVIVAMKNLSAANRFQYRINAK
ncbi:hypothetical protein SAMN04488104_104510 [Algoriphagus faecimaris]|uniref:Uncharacterized protein n=1 Tax=Algoriphagus faecimaris TaxID=686796 RepID=A0A1G6WM10_9BACT|nr:hypothetical protein [Algoriphagus faecimaris]SDD66116.1 hypothetical protein SAMN04488104_104510 [Algoriphagus faecimaris]